VNSVGPPRRSGLLGDTTERDYSAKLLQFNTFAAPELRRLVAALELRAGMWVLDAGTGTGDALPWLADRVGPQGMVVGMDLATAHVQVARRRLPAEFFLLQADLRQLPLRAASVDAVWCANTLHHLRDPAESLQQLIYALRPGGCMALIQSALLPEMVFAWDSRLERKVTAAVRRYYQDRYAISEQDIAGVRNMLALLQRGGLENVRSTTIVIERIAPLSSADRDYLLDAIFRNTWGERLRPYMNAVDYAVLQTWCDPQHPAFALARRDFHYLQTLTMVTGYRPPESLS
jgi:ubiquinone/menaquinone biosynthesis C-methylase UbiE